MAVDPLHQIGAVAANVEMKPTMMIAAGAMRMMTTKALIEDGVGGMMMTMTTGPADDSFCVARIVNPC